MMNAKCLVLRHRKENLKKCSLRGLQDRSDVAFLTYPKDPLPDLSPYIMLTLGAPPLTKEDAHYGCLLIDGTWRYAEKMVRYVLNHSPNIIQRSIPPGWKTAYPRCQEGCADPESGLASVEALWIAYYTLGFPTSGLLDNYFWKQNFLTLNSKLL
jgi:pre-rRNA-processing protein TSR3